MNLRGRYTFRGWPKLDYIKFFLSVGSVFGAFFLSLFFTILLNTHNIIIPPQLYSIPIGLGLFAFAWIFDSIAHRSVYKNIIDRNEFLVHSYMTVGSGFPLFACFLLSYFWPWFMLPFVCCFAFLKLMYSLIDEGIHWTRFKEGRSDAIEMTAHFIQFGSNVLFDVGFLYLIYWNHFQVIKLLFS